MSSLFERFAFPIDYFVSYIESLQIRLFADKLATACQAPQEVIADGKFRLFVYLPTAFVYVLGHFFFIYPAFGTAMRKFMIF